MKKVFILLFCIISILFSQVVPPNLLNDIDRKTIPKNLNYITENEFNISFNEYAISKTNDLGTFSYLKINSTIQGNYQIKIAQAFLPNESYIVFFDKDSDCMYGPYNYLDGDTIFPSIMNGNEVIIIYFEPYNAIFKGNFLIESIQSIENISSHSEILDYKIKKTRDRPVLMVTGYWPPTNEMLRHFSQKLELNPEGWQGENWRDLGFDIVSFFPEFNPPDCNDCGQGYGDLEVDYQDTSEDFWVIINEIKPSGIITFSRGYNNNSWELESNVYNHASWIADYTSPYFPTPTPPDDSVEAGHNRGSALPMDLIEEILDNSDLDINCYIDQNGNAGRFLSEFMGYHGMWYHQSSIESEWPCLLGGHIHVGGQLSTRMATDAAELTIEIIAGYLDELMITIGDINDDDIINIQDVILLINYILDGTEVDENILQVADINEDGILNVQDVVILINLILN